MKISKSKQELASIINENGGWRDGAESAAQCKGGEISFWHDTATKERGENWCGSHLGESHDIQPFGYKLPNWHQTILSRAEYFHLYPEPDADGWIEWNGGECPVGGDAMVACKFRAGKEFRNGKEIPASILRWSHTGGMDDIIAYRLHKPEQAKYSAVGDDQANLADKKELETMEYKPSIEQLMQIHCDRAHALSEKKAEFLVAEKQELEALEALKAACMEAGFDIAPITTKQEPELVITDWRDLQVGDEIEYLGGTSAHWVGRHGTVALIDPDDESTILFQDGHEWESGDPRNWMSTRWCDSFRFIRRP